MNNLMETKTQPLPRKGKLLSYLSGPDMIQYVAMAYGARTIEESLEIIKEADKGLYKKIVADMNN